MSVRGPSVIIPAIAGLHTVLAAVTWPDLEATGGQVLSAGTAVEVTFGGMMEAPTHEMVNVTGIVTDDVQQWDGVTLPSKRSTWSALTSVTTNVPNRTAAQAWARLGALLSTMENTLRDETSGRPIIPSDLALLGVFDWMVSSISTALMPLPEVGWVASATVLVTVQADY